MHRPTDKQTVLFNQINFNKAIKSSHTSNLQSANSSIHANYHGGDRNTGLTQQTHQKHRHTNSNGSNPQQVSSFKQSMISTNNPFISITGGTIDSGFRGHTKNAISVGTYENSAKMVKRNNYMSGNVSHKGGSHQNSTYGFHQQ